MNLEQIEKRLAELEGLIKAEKDTAKLEEYGKEVRSLIEEKGRILGEATGEARAKAMQAFSEGNVRKISDGTKVEPEAKPMSKRDAFALIIGLQVKREKATDVQMRAIAGALTTTSTSFVEATETLVGTNNGGVFIPTQLLFELLVEEGKLSPLVADIAFTAYKGIGKYTYRKSRTKANAKKEGSGTDRNQVQWDELILVQGKLQIVIDVTDELAAATAFDIGSYIANSMLSDLGEDWAEDLIYGEGANQHVAGVTHGLTAVTYSSGDGNALASVVAALKTLKRPYRKGAKIYVSQEVYDDIFFSVDQNGNFKYPVFNNASGITSLGPIRVELDENLNGGDYIIGNIGKWYKGNFTESMRLGVQRDEVAGITTYVANQAVAAAPFASGDSKKPVFVWGKCAA